MKSLQYTLGIIFGLFLTITCKQAFYSRYNLENSVTTFYTHEVNDVPLVTCALLCLSTEGCTYFYWHNRSCLIVNPTVPDNSSVNITSIYVDDVLKDNCNLDGYDAIFGGVLCVKVYGTVQMNWEDAKTTCKQGGGQLLVMRTSVFYLKLEALKSLEPSVDRLEYWIGGNDLTTEGEFTWIDGSDVTTEGWGIHEPNNGNGDEHCLQFLSLQFNDNQCFKPRYFLCEKTLV